MALKSFHLEPGREQRHFLSVNFSKAESWTKGMKAGLLKDDTSYKFPLLKG